MPKNKKPDPGRPVYVLGEIVIDVILYDPSSICVFDQPVWARDIRFMLGGSASYVAQGLNALGCPVVINSFAGDDDLTSQLLRSLDRQGLDTGAVLRQAGVRTSICIGVSDKGKKRFIGCSLFAPYPSELLAEPPSNASLVYFGGLAMYPDLWDGRLAAYLEAAGKHAWVIMDTQMLPIPAEKYRTQAINWHNLHPVDVLLVNRAEAMALTGLHQPDDAGRALLEFGPKCVVVKLGSDGALAVQAGTSVTLVSKSWSVKVEEPVGAGDFFGAGLSFGLLQGWGMQRCLDFANVFAGLVISRQTGDMPDLARTLEIMESHFLG
ncbi:MAG: carbohydrate kinase family protein [Anaerolineae bacterium]|nr:carbohydrate kinase family protein [Anaerolineae bacterium]